MAVLTKFDCLLQRIAGHRDLSLILTDFGVYEHQMSQLVDAINQNDAIKILHLDHNELTDRSAEPLSRLLHIETLIVSYNNITSVGIQMMWLALSARNTKCLIAKYNADVSVVLKKDESENL